MNSLEIVERIESIADGQPEEWEIWEALEILQTELLVGQRVTLEEIRERRLAEFEAMRAPGNNQILSRGDIAAGILELLGAKQ